MVIDPQISVLSVDGWAERCGERVRWWPGIAEPFDEGGVTVVR